MNLSTLHAPRSTLHAPRSPTAFIRTEIRFLKPDQYFLDEQGRVCHKIGCRWPLRENTRLGIKHLAVTDVPYSRKILELRAHTLIWADPNPRRRAEFPLDYAYELMPTDSVQPSAISFRPEPEAA